MGGSEAHQGQDYLDDLAGGRDRGRRRVGPRFGSHTASMRLMAGAGVGATSGACEAATSSRAIASCTRVRNASTSSGRSRRASAFDWSRRPAGGSSARMPATSASRLVSTSFMPEPWRSRVVVNVPLTTSFGVGSTSSIGQPYPEQGGVHGQVDRPRLRARVREGRGATRTHRGLLEAQAHTE